MAKILIITEGKKPENRIIDSIRESLGYTPCKKYEFVWGYWGAGILDLYDKLVQDDEQDYLPLLKRNKDNFELQDYSVDDFGQIFLFFDFDPQSQTEKNDEGQEKGVINFAARIKEILMKCSDETSPFGKLFLSYPMIEAYLSFPYKRECNSIECFFDEHSSKVFASRMHSINTSASIHHHSDGFWNKVLSYHLNKICLFMGISNTYGSISKLETIDVYNKQQEMRAKSDLYFALSPISLFMLSIYGQHFYSTLDFESDTLLCACPCLIS